MTAKANLEHSQGIARHKEDNNERKITNTKVSGTLAKQKNKKRVGPLLVQYGKWIRDGKGSGSHPVYYTCNVVTFDK